MPFGTAPIVGINGSHLNAASLPDIHKHFGVRTYGRKKVPSSWRGSCRNREHTCLVLASGIENTWTAAQ